MGIIKNNKKEYCTLKQNKEEKQPMTEGWISEKELTHMINVLRGYINEIYYTKEELNNLLYDSNIDEHVPKKLLNYYQIKSEEYILKRNK